MLSPEREAVLKDGEVLEAILNDDAIDSLKAALASGTQQSRRVAARAVFAYVEGMAYVLRQNCLAFHEAGDHEFSAAELSLLKEESYSLDDRGQVEIRPDWRGGLRRWLRFSVGMFARFFDLKYELDCSGAGWKAFSDALEIRRRVTHPKSGAELSISDEELKVIWEGFTWFHDQMKAVYERSADEMLRRGEEHVKRVLAPGITSATGDAAEESPRSTEK